MSLEAKGKLEAFQADFKRANQLRNQEAVLQQMREKKERDAAGREYDRLYAKPHFGPEETAEAIAARADEEAQKKRLLKEVLKHQIYSNKDQSETSKLEEREKDLAFLHAAANTQHVENLAVRRKEDALK